MPKPPSAGILLASIKEDGVLRFFIAHMGGPFWARKDEGAWSLPKGEYEPLGPSAPREAALREFQEEIGVSAPALDYLELGEFRQSSGKVITAFLGVTEHDVRFVGSNEFELEWPPKSGNIRSFPEVDRAEWFDAQTALTKVVKGQVPILEAAMDRIRETGLEFEAQAPPGEADPPTLF